MSCGFPDSMALMISAQTLLLLLLTDPLIAPVSGCDCNTSWSALAELFNSTSGSNWHRRDKWLEPGTTVCDWYGVTCESIDLGSNNLVGTLPVTFFHGLPSRLSKLNISFNRIDGTLPPWQSAASTEGFRIAFHAQSNRLFGSIPQSLSFIRFSHFDVSMNSFTGTLPDQLGDWGSGMLDFRVSNNSLTGTLPESFRAWQNLKSFSCHSNQFTGSLPSSWTSWWQLDSFFVDGNHLSGTLPQSYANLTNIVRFIAYNNQLIGELPNMTQWIKLRVLLVDNNRLSGPLPILTNNVAGSEEQKRIGVTNNHFSGSIPSSWCELSNLKFLDLYSNSLEGEIPSCLARLPLNRFRAEHNKLSGTLTSDLQGRWQEGSRSVHHCRQ